MTPADLAARFGRALAAAEDARRAALADGANQILEAIQEAIGTMDGPGGPYSVWANLAEQTLEQKERRGQLGRVSEQDKLLATGAFRASWSVDLTDPDNPKVTSTSPLAPLFEDGTRTMPPRPLLHPIMQQLGPQIAQAARLAYSEAFKRALDGDA